MDDDQPWLAACTLLGAEEGLCELKLDLSSEELQALVEDPTLIGWSYQIWNEASRSASTWAVSKRAYDQAERLSIVAATQIFTEEYMADFLALRSHRLLSERNAGYTVLDPACGTGHILVRVMRLLLSEVRSEVAHGDVERIAGQLYGCDIDPDAVSLCRAVLLLESLRRAPHASVALVMEILSRNIFVLDHPHGVLKRDEGFPALSRSYDCVLCNPPYLGRRKLTQQMREILDLEYPDGALDLCAAVTRRCIELTKQGGVLGLVTSDKWLRLRGYSSFRRSLYRDLSVDVIAELGDRAFRSQLDLHDGVGVVLTVGQRRDPSPQHSVQYLSIQSKREVQLKADYLADHTRSQQGGVMLPQQALSDDCDGGVFLRGAGAPLALQHATSRLVSQAQVIVGLQTNDDERFVRYHWEVAPQSTNWIPHNKGGGYARWFGLNRWVLDRRPESMANYQLGMGEGRPLHEWFAESGWTYSWFANGCFGVRFKEAGWSFGRAASSGLFCDDHRIVAYCNSRFASLCARFIGGKIQLPEGVVRRIPLPDSLSFVDPNLVHAAVKIKRRLVSADPTDLTFAPDSRPDLSERFALEALLLAVEGRLEEQVMQSISLSQSEREQAAQLIAEPVALRFGAASRRAWHELMRSLPSEWHSLAEALAEQDAGREPRGLRSDDHGEAVRLVLQRGYTTRLDIPSLPAEGPLEKLCSAVEMHPCEAFILVTSTLREDVQLRDTMLAEECRLSLLIAVLRSLGFRWHSEDHEEDLRALSINELLSAASQVVDCDKARTLLGCSVEVWIRKELDPWHAKLLLNAPILWRPEGEEGFAVRRHDW
jgi:SAM-dependent methyltransferase